MLDMGADAELRRLKPCPRLVVARGAEAAIVVLVRRYVAAARRVPAFAFASGQDRDQHRRRYYRCYALFHWLFSFDFFLWGTF